MPQSRHALQNLLHIMENELSQVEARLLETISVEESAKLVDKAARLHLRLEEIKAILNEAAGS
jgi:hypothetical protein